MNHLKRKSSSKIDLQVKLFALDLYNRGNRISVISKKIGYSEPTIKYWVNHSESIRSQDKSETNHISYKELALNDSLDFQPNGMYKNNYIDKRMSENHYITSGTVRFLDKYSCTSHNSMRPSIENVVSFNGNSYDNEENTNDQINSATSTKDTENMVLNSPPKLVEYPNNINHFNHSINSNGIVQKTYVDLNESNDFRNFNSDFQNCQEVIEELMDFIATGKKLLNKASNFLYQMQETMNNYEIRKKVKYECQ